jgi:DNA polymerase III sliding clamp (beta) subunit (PCNA family)
MIFDITKVIQRITKAASKDETRPYLNAVCFRNGNAYATDGHIIVASIPVAESTDMFVEAGRHMAKEYVVPVWIIDKFDFTKTRPTIQLECGEEQAEAHYDKKNLSIPVIKEGYPDAESAIPRDTPIKTVRMNAELLKIMYELAKGDTGCEWVEFDIYPDTRLGYRTSNEFRGMIALMRRGGEPEANMEADTITDTAE